MSILSSGLGRTAFSITAFALAVVSLNWPFVTIYGRYGLAASYLGIFSTWLIHIGVLYLIGRARFFGGAEREDSSG